MNSPNMQDGDRRRKSILKVKRPRRAGDPAAVYRRFAAEKFSWLDCVAKDARNLPPLASAVAILLCPLFNLDHQGAAWPAHDSLAQALGVSRLTIVRTLAALVERGHLDAQRHGQHRSNTYWMTKEPRCINPDTSEAPDVSTLNARCIKVDTQISSKTTEQVQEDLSLAEMCGGAEVETGNLPTAVDRFPELRAVWTRPHLEDDDRDREAFAKACRETSVETILAAARTWVGTVADTRYLPPLWKWLGGRGWEKPPPPARKSGNRAVNGKRDPLMVAIKMTTREDEHGNLVDNETGAIVMSARVLQ